jgi:hypothetical protein
MTPFAKIARAASGAGVDFLLIGGHAVNAYGYQRTTLDIDLLVSEVQLEAWKGVLASLGYVLGHETSAFVQFAEPPGSEEFPIDLMVVDAPTFQRLASGSTSRRFGDVDLRIPRVIDLIALKLHALRSPARAARGKDLPDILELMRECGLHPSDPQLAAVIERYASEATRAELRRTFPDPHLP